MPFLFADGGAPAFRVAGVACFRPAVFFWAAAVRSEGSGVGSVCRAVGWGVGEVSSGKVVLHVMSLETKKFSLAGRESQAYNTSVIRTPPAACCVAPAEVWGRYRTGRRLDNESGQPPHTPNLAMCAAPAPGPSPPAARIRPIPQVLQPTAEPPQPHPTAGTAAPRASTRRSEGLRHRETHEYRIGPTSPAPARSAAARSETGRAGRESSGTAPPRYTARRHHRRAATPASRPHCVPPPSCLNDMPQSARSESGQASPSIPFKILRRCKSAQSTQGNSVFALLKSTARSVPASTIASTPLRS